MLVINEIAFRIAWNASRGGKFGSEIHWAVRIPTFIILWAIIYSLIFLVKWIFLNRIIVFSITGGIILLAVVMKITILLIKKTRKKIDTITSHYVYEWTSIK